MTENLESRPAGFQQPGAQQPGAQQPGVAGSKFGTEAYDPHAAYGGPMQRPKSFDRVRQLTIVSFLTYMLSSGLSMVVLNDEQLYREQLEAQGQEATQEALDFMTMSALVGGILMLVVGLVIYLVVLLGLKNAKNWARILGTVFCALGIISMAFSLTGIGALLSAGALGIIVLVTSLLFILVNVMWLISAFSKDTNAYIADRAKR